MGSAELNSELWETLGEQKTNKRVKFDISRGSDEVREALRMLISHVPVHGFDLMFIMSIATRAQKCNETI